MLSYIQFTKEGDEGAIHKRHRNILWGGGGGSQIPMLQDIRR